jgi:hypothetical protein
MVKFVILGLSKSWGRLFLGFSAFLLCSTAVSCKLILISVEYESLIVLTFSRMFSLLPCIILLTVHGNSCMPYLIYPSRCEKFLEGINHVV